MGKKKGNVCPGCGRSCTAENVRCRYGKSYFEKQRAATQAVAERERYKWERYVVPEGFIWQLLMMSKRLKKALKNGSVTEEQLMDELNGGEKDLLAATISKVEEVIKKSGRNV